MVGRGRIVATLVVIAAALGVAGCGSSSGSSSETTTTEAVAVVPEKTFVANASHVCEAGDKKKSDALEKAVGAKGINVNQIEGEHLISNVVLPIYTETNEELAALPKPKGHEKDVEAIVANVKQSIAEAEAEPILALNGKAFIKPDEEITAMGIPECIF
jgi:hypothetical protein